MYRNAMDTRPVCSPTIMQVLENITTLTGADFPEIKQIREAENKDLKAKLKRTLPAVTFSGLFENSHKASELIKHSGFICIDIDSVDHANGQSFDTQEMKTYLSKIDVVYFACLSVGGRGLMALVPIRYPERHKDHFKQMQSDFQAIGIKIDVACSDVSRLRFITFDPEPVWKETATLYEGLPKVTPVAPTVPVVNRHKIVKHPEKKSTMKGGIASGQAQLMPLDFWIDEQVSKKTQFIQGQRNLFTSNYAYLANEYGMTQSDCINYLQKYVSESFTIDEIQRTVSSVYRNKTASHGIKKSTIS